MFNAQISSTSTHSLQRFDRQRQLYESLAQHYTTLPPFLHYRIACELVLGALLILFTIRFGI